MSAFKGTPGPWRVVEDIDGLEVWAEHQQPVASLYAFRNADRVVDPQANGRLIAAAPELLEVAKRVRWLLAQKPYPGRERDEATILGEVEAALAKVLGEDKESA